MTVQALLVDLAIRYGFQIVGAGVILVLGALVARWLGRVTDHRLERQRMEPPMRLLIVRVIRVVVLLLALVVALDKLGFQIAPLVAGIGVAGLGVGFALQGVLSNLMAGLTIIFTKPFRVGEHIAVAGVNGDVATVELFSTTLVHPDRSRVIVPNRKIVGEILHNFGTMRQIDVTVAVPRDANLTAVLALAEEVVAANPRVLADPAPAIGIARVGESRITISVQPWVRVADVTPGRAELYQALVERFRAEAIGVPIPRQDVGLVHLNS